MSMIIESRRITGYGLASYMAWCPLLIASAASAAPAEPQWTGQSKMRILVRVDPLDLKGRTDDEMVAHYGVNFVDLLAKHPVAGGVDLATLQVQKFDPQTGAPEKFKPFDNA